MVDQSDLVPTQQPQLDGQRVTTKAACRRLELSPRVPVEPQGIG